MHHSTDARAHDRGGNSRRAVTTAVAVVAALLVAGAAAAALAGTAGATLDDPAQTTISIDDETASSGDTVVVALEIRGTDVAGYTANVTYDSEAATFEAVDGGDFDEPLANHDADDGWVALTQSRPQTATANETVAAQLTFAVDDETDLELQAGTHVTDETGSKHSIERSNGSISIEEADDGGGSGLTGIGGSNDESGDEAETDDADEGDSGAGDDAASDDGTVEEPSPDPSGDEVTDDEESVSADDGADDSDDELPGFGIVAALGALLGALVVLTRR